MATKRAIEEFFKGLFRENPVLIILLGLCPTLAVSTSVINTLGMGIAVTFVLVFSNIIISSLRKFIPQEIRIPSFILIIASFVVICELLMRAYSPFLSKQLGIFVPLIVVNCIIMGRAEAYASKNSVFFSFLDALGMGLGFSIALMVISVFREIFGAGRIFGFLLWKEFTPITVMILPPGALLTLGILIGFMNLIRRKR
jgi:electron transport complex protein RnfE